MQIELLLPAALVAGFLGSGHCFGMCGPVVVLLEQTATPAWTRRVFYNIGRLGFYVLLGAIAGAIGLVLTKISGVELTLRALRILAGMLVIAIGLNLLLDLRLLGFLERAGAGVWRRLSPLARHVLPADTLPRALGAGFIWGALPCGLVYSAVAMAATTGNAAGGSMVMLLFWIGTLPALLTAGAAAARLGTLTRNRWLRSASGLLLIGIGAFALYMPYMSQGDSGHQHQAWNALPEASQV